MSKGFSGYPQPSHMGHDFSKVPAAEIPRSSFDRSHGHKTAFDSGYLVPVFVDEALPGDTFNLKMSSFARLSTPIAPFMDNLSIDVFFFAVPLRLIWTNFKKFMGEKRRNARQNYCSTACPTPCSTYVLSASYSNRYGSG